MSSNFEGEGTVTYTYSGDQKRRSRSVSGGVMTKYRVDQGFGVVNEENSGGTLLSTYIHHPGRQIGTVLATSEGSTASSGTWNYYFQDAIGSTRSLWDEDGDRLGKYDYTPFGGKYGNTGEEITRKFTGHDWDTEARLYHTAYRQYSPDTGRWLTRDPLGMVDGPNVYAYVVNNPVSMFDALGLAGVDAATLARLGRGMRGGSGLLTAALYLLTIELVLPGLEHGFDPMPVLIIAWGVMMANPFDGFECTVGPRGGSQLPPNHEPPTDNGCGIYCGERFPNGGALYWVCVAICTVAVGSGFF